MNLMESLTREIQRVTEIKGIYEQTGRECKNAMVAPAIFAMNQSLEAAHQAMRENDVGKMMQAHEDLREFDV